MLSNCGSAEDSWESLGLQRDPAWDFWRRSALGFLWKNDAKAETPVLWPAHAKSWLIGKDSDAGRAWGQEEKRMTEDEMAGWHHWVNGRESEWTPGVGAGQGSLACCDSWGRKELEMTEQMNWTELMNYMSWNWSGPKICLKKWQEYTEKLYKKDHNLPDNHSDVIAHLKLDILSLKSRGPQEATLQTKLVEVMEFQLSYFKS